MANRVYAQQAGALGLAELGVFIERALVPAASPPEAVDIAGIPYLRAVAFIVSLRGIFGIAGELL